MKLPELWPSKQARLSVEPTFTVVGEGASVDIWLSEKLIEKIEIKGTEASLVAEVVSEAVNTALTKIEASNPGIRNRAAQTLINLQQATDEGQRLTIRGKVFTVLPEYPTE